MSNPRNAKNTSDAPRKIPRSPWRAMACNKMKLFPCSGSMNHAGFMEGRRGGREGGGGVVGGGGEVRRGGGREVRRGGGGEEGRREGGGVFAWIMEHSYESWRLSMGRVSLCYSIRANCS